MKRLRKDTKTTKRLNQSFLIGNVEPPRLIHSLVNRNTIVLIET